MPPRPFPFPLGIGIDIVSIDRIRGILGKGNVTLQRYLRRFLTEQERKPILRTYGAADLADDNVAKRLSHFLAGRWAAKEAVIKAVTWRKLTFHDIIIRQPRYSTSGYVHAVILDPISLNDSQVESEASSQAPKSDLVGSGRHGSSSRNASSMESSSKHTEPSQRVASSTMKPDPQQQESNISSSRDGQNDTTVLDLLPQTDEFPGDPSGQIAQISISHDGDYATAVCLAAQEPLAGDVGGELQARML